MVVIVLYIVVGWQLPPQLVDTINSDTGFLVCVVGSLACLVYNPLMGMLLFIALARISRHTTWVRNKVFELSDPAYWAVDRAKAKFADWPDRPRFPWTLEQSVIARMAPIRRAPEGTRYSWKPLIGYLHDAASAQAV